jgi:hypothetical protein
MVTEKQIPGPFVSFDALALKRWRQVEHHNVLLVVRENGGKIVPADSIRPALEKGCDPGFFGGSLCRHNLDSLLRPYAIATVVICAGRCHETGGSFQPLYPSLSAFGRMPIRAEVFAGLRYFNRSVPTVWSSP